MKHIGMLLCLVLLPFSLNAGNIYEVKSKGEADVAVCLVGSEGEADLCVFVADNQADAKGKDEVWFYVTSQGSANAKVYFVKSKTEADIKVFMAKSRGQAGWKKSNKCRGKLK